ncbi:hypothetical protein BRC86_08580 [Halobacteriales archaeon QS_3_64_16]|nr:MAG: hypothetical protein BRC86_08580 [Halobacteriales archaeon QS_3_64_16]
MRDPSLLSMTWRDVLFAHWPVAPSVVEEKLPPGLTVDTHDGQAWLGVVAFRMDPIKPRYSPLGLTFGECNLRTYVTPADATEVDADPDTDLEGNVDAGSESDPNPGPGIYFFNLDASDRLSVTLARRLFDLPYYTARMDISRRGEEVRFHSRRTHSGVPLNRFAATYRPTGEPFRAEAGSIEAFLAERYRFYTAAGDGLAVGEIEHDPWQLQPAAATIETNTCFEANGFDRPEGEPLLHYSRTLPVSAGRLRRC